MRFLSALLIVLVSNVALAFAQNSIFPWANDTDRPECKTCLDNLVSETCGGESNSGFDKCLCDGKGAAQLNDDCFPECCSASTICQGQGPYREWWLQCVDNYPALCADPPSAIGLNRDLEEHCTREDIEQAKKTQAEDEKDDKYVNDLGDINREDPDEDRDGKNDKDQENGGVMYHSTLGNFLGVVAISIGMYLS